VTTFAWTLILPLLAAPPAPTAASEPAPWVLRGVEARLSFNGDLLRALGLRLTKASGPDADGRLRVDLQGVGTLTATAPRGVFGTIVSGEVGFEEAPALVWSGGLVGLGGARLRGGLTEKTLEILGADGALLFTADHMHVNVDRQAGRIRLYNLDLRLSPGLAGRLGEPRHTGLPVATLEVRAAVEIPAGSVESLEGACTNPVWGPNDVGLVDIESVSQSAIEPGVRVAITPSASLSNQGTTDVPWYEKFHANSPPYNNDQHPLLTWNLYRVAGGALEQIGASAMKHAFFTINSGCACAGGNILWVGCGDTYGVGTNEDRFNLGPRSELTAHTGIWLRCGSIFDPNCDGIQDTPPIVDAFDRRMTVVESDLQTPGAEYYFDAWYVVRDDVNIFNTMGWKRVQPSFSGGTWSFALLTPLNLGAVVDEWVDPSAPGPNADNRLLDTGEGRLKVAVRATDLGGGQWSYAYVISNLDFDRRIGSFTVPRPSGTTVTNLVFHDGDNDATTDWAATVTPGSIVWQTPVDPGAQDWGRLFSFGFQVNAAPVAGAPVTVTLGIQEAPGGVLTTPIVGPSMITPVELQRFDVE